MDFSFLSPVHLIVRRGGVDGLGDICSAFGKKPGIFRFGQSFMDSGLYSRVKDALTSAGLTPSVFRAQSGEPAPRDIDEAAAFLRDNACDSAIAIGGGSVIDMAKAACALAPNGEDIMDYVEGFDPKAFVHDPLPLVALPTTAGTGSECTKNSVITEPGVFKNSVRDDRMLPRVALLDAAIMTSVPRGVTVNAGADAVCQLVEAYVSAKATPMTDALALHFTTIALGALPRAVENGDDLDAREQMAVCAAASGMCLANGGLGAAHGIAAGVGAMTGLTHGFLCGVLLPHIMRFNIQKGVFKYADIARAAGHAISDDTQAALKAVVIVQKLFDSIGLPHDLRGHGIWGEDAKKIAKASMGSSMQKNPCEVTLEECEQIVRSLL